MASKDTILAAVLAVVFVGTIVAIGSVVYDGSVDGYAHLFGMVTGFYVVMMLVAFLSKGRVSKNPSTPGKLTIAHDGT